MPTKNINKKNKCEKDFDKSSTFIEIQSEFSKHSKLISVEDLIKNNYNIEKDIDKITLIIDPKTKKVKVDFSVLKSLSVLNVPFKESNILSNLSPVNASELSSMHGESTIYLSVDKNFLYVWVGKRWKRVTLSEW